MASSLSSKDPAAPADRVPELSVAARWLVLFLLATGVLIAFVDRTSISSALADAPFIAHFDLSDVDRG